MPCLHFEVWIWPRGHLKPWEALRVVLGLCMGVLLMHYGIQSAKAWSKKQQLVQRCLKLKRTDGASNPDVSNWTKQVVHKQSQTVYKVQKKEEYKRLFFSLRAEDTCWFFVASTIVGQLVAGDDTVCACGVLECGAPHVTQALPLVTRPFLQSLADTSGEAEQLQAHVHLTSFSSTLLLVSEQQIISCPGAISH